MKFLFLFLIVTTSLYSFAGSAQAELNCISNSGKTKIKAIVPGDSYESLVKITINNETKTMHNQLFKESFDLNDATSLEEEYPHSQLSEIAVVNHIIENIFTVSISIPNNAVLEIYSIPETVKYTSKYDGAVYNAKFKAKIYGNLAYLFNKEKLPYSIDLNCSLEYSL